MSNPQPLEYGILKEWLEAERILCYRIHLTNKTATDAWANDLRHELLMWPSHKPYRALFDMTHSGTIFGAYALARARELSRLRPEMPGRLAILISNKMMAQAISVAVRTNGNSYRQRLIFNHEKNAVDWLLAGDRITR